MPIYSLINPVSFSRNHAMPDQCTTKKCKKKSSVCMHHLNMLMMLMFNRSQGSDDKATQLVAFMRVVMLFIRVEKIRNTYGQY